MNRATAADLYPEQVAKANAAIVELSTLFGEYEPLLQAEQDTENRLYLSIPVGYHEALEVNALITRSFVFYSVTQIAWDRTGGIRRDEEIGESTLPHIVSAIVQAQLNKIKADNERVEAVMGEGE